MKFSQLAIVLTAITVPVSAVAQSGPAYETHPAAYHDHAGPISSGCSTCTKTGFTQYARPYHGFSLAYKATPYPKDPCCATIVGEFVCDLKQHIANLINCDGDIFGVSHGACCGQVAGCGEAIDCVPRLRDLLPWPGCCGHLGIFAPFLDPRVVFGRPYYGAAHYYGDSFINQPYEDQDTIIEGAGDRELVPRPNLATPPQPGKVPTGRSTTPPATRLRSLIGPPDVPTARRTPRIESLPPQRIPSRTAASRRRATRPVAAQRDGLSEQGFVAAIAHDVPTKEVKVSAPKKLAVRPAVRVTRIRPRSIQFGDQFGKSASSRLRGATFQ